jgi:Phycobilisome protein
MDERLRQLSINARILGLMYDKTLPPSIRAIFKQADAGARPLSDLELRVICRFSTVDADNLQRLQSKTPQIITSAKNQLLEKDPSLNQPGGALYPEARAEACWRDCWHFLRVTIYAVAAGRPAFTHPGGVRGLSNLYRELAVPISSMALAIGFLKAEALSDFSTYASPSDASILREALLHLEQMIQQLPQRSGSDAEVPI